MGAELAKIVSARYAHLPIGQFKILVRMALVALDKPSGDRPASTYFGGWEDLAQALGREAPYLSADAATLARKRRNLRTEVSKHCAALKAAGVIRSAVENPGIGTRQVWVLKLREVGLTALPVVGLSVQPRGRSESTQEVGPTDQP